MITDTQLFADKLKEFVNELKYKLPVVSNEEMTKTSLVLPFLHFLGYDIFNPRELQAEFTSEIGINDERIDYAIIKDGVPALLIEVKAYGTKLDNHINQLYKYYAAQTGVKICILTDGVIYRFFADFDAINVMDLTPFLEINLLKLKQSHIIDIMQLQKNVFDIKTLYNKANKLSYANKMLAYIKKQAIEPDYDFLRVIVKNFYEPKFTQKAYENFLGLYKNVYN